MPFGTPFFILLTVVPNTALGLALALMVMRLRLARRWVLAMFFLPHILPVRVVTNLRYPLPQSAPLSK
jgi:multiple sugar transport system permease protein